MSLPISNLKFVNHDEKDNVFNFIADYFDADNNETCTLIVSYCPDNDYELHINIDGQSHSDDIDSIDDSQYFDADSISFIVSTAQSI